MVEVTPPSPRTRHRRLSRALVAIGVAVTSAIGSGALAASAPATPSAERSPDLWGFTTTMGSTAAWGSADLTATNALPSFVAAPSTVDNGGQLLSVGLTTNGQVLLLAGGSPNQAGWTSTNLTADLGLTSTTAPVLVLDQAGEAVVATRDPNGDLVLSTNTVVGRSPWQQVDLTSQSGGPATIGIPAIVEDSAGTEVFTRTSAGHLVEFTDVGGTSGQFRAVDLTALAGAVTITSDPVATSDPASSQHHVAALGAKGTVVEYADDDATQRFWSARIFTPPTAAVSAPVLCDVASTTWIFVATANHDLVTFTGKVNLPAAQWQVIDLTDTATGGAGVSGQVGLAVANGHVDLVAESSFANFVTYDAQLTTPSPTWRATEVAATATFSPAPQAFSLAAVGTTVVLLAAGVLHVAAAGTGVYAIPMAKTAKALADGWPIVGVTGALGAPNSPYTGLANSGQDLLTGKAIAASAKPATWLSFWTVSGPPIAANLEATACGLLCTSVGEATAVDGSTQGIVLRSTAQGPQVATWVAPPPNAAADPKVQLGAVACAALGGCTAAGSAVDASGHRLPIVVTIDATSATARFGSLPAGAATAGAVEVRAIACPGTTCVEVGDFVDSVGRTRGFMETSTATTVNPSVVVWAPAGSSSNPHVALRGLACSTPTSCVAVGSVLDSTGRTRSLVAYLAATGPTSSVFGSVPTGSATNPGAALDAVACSSLNCTAVGTFTRSSAVQAAMVTTLGATGVGTSVAVPAPSGSATNALAALTGVACPTTTCLGVGNYTDHLGRHATMAVQILNGNPATATSLPSPAGSPSDPGVQLDAVACSGILTCRAVGQATDPSGDPALLVDTWAGTTLVSAAYGVLPQDSGSANPAGAFYQAGLAAGQYVGGVLATYPSEGLNLQPDFVILDPEGYPDNHSGLDGPPGATSTAKWTAILQGWADGLHVTNPGTHPGVYADQYEYATYGLAKLTLPAFLAVAWTVSTKVVGNQVVLSGPPTPPTKTTSGPNVDGYISFNDFCPSEWPDHAAYLRQLQMFQKPPWNGTYNTLQFLGPNDYCAPS